MIVITRYSGRAFRFGLYKVILANDKFILDNTKFTLVQSSLRYHTLFLGVKLERRLGGKTPCVVRVERWIDRPGTKQLSMAPQIGLERRIPLGCSANLSVLNPRICHTFLEEGNFRDGGNEFRCLLCPSPREDRCQSYESEVACLRRSLQRRMRILSPNSHLSDSFDTPPTTLPREWSSKPGRPECGSLPAVGEVTSQISTLA